MTIQHNLSAMNANRQFNIVTKSKKKSTEKLSSGYRINRAADDAAGLAISEKMRRQIRGLNQGAENIQDGISLCQVADGALAETQDIIQRMNELSVQAANGTNADQDRGYINQEVQQLKSEVNRIANNTTFNEGIFPLKTKYDSVIEKESYCSETGEIYNFNIADMAETTPSYRGLTFVQWYKNYYGASYTATDTNGNKLMFTLNYTSATDTNGEKFINKNDPITGDSFKVDVGGMYSYSGDDVSYDSRGNSYWYEPKIDYEVKSGTTKDAVSSIMNKITSISIDADGSINLVGSLKHESEKSGEDSDIWIQSGSEAGVGWNLHTVDATASTLGISGVDVSTTSGAESAINSVKSALAKVSEYRSYFGAMQNRMEHAYNNNLNIVENTQDAESQIRDTDMATEMVKYSNSDIVAQAGQSMLAQANQLNQAVLSLIS